MLYMWEDIRSKSLTEITLDNEIENIFTEINLRSKKWLISGSYNPKLSHIKNHLQEIGKGLDYYSSKYENFIVLGDFNSEMSNPQGLPNNYITLKLPFFDLCPPLPPLPSCFITNDNKTPPYVTSRLTQIPFPLLYHLFLFFFLFLRLEKQQNKDAHPPMTHPPMFLSNWTKLSGLNEK